MGRDSPLHVLTDLFEPNVGTDNCFSIRAGELAKLTVTGKNYLPNYFHMHAYAGVLNKLLVSAPLFVMATISVRARSELADFGFVAYSAAQNNAIDSYVDLVKATVNVVHPNTYSPVPEVRKMAAVWISASKAGKLGALTPVSFDDTTRDGVKGEILRANLRVAEELNDYGDEERTHGKYWKACQDAVLGAQTAEVTKYFDFASLSCAGLAQRRSIAVVKACLPHLTESQRKRVVGQLAVCRGDGVQIVQMAEAERLCYLRFLLRRGADISTVSHIEKVIGDNQDYNTNARELAEQMHKRLDTVEDDTSAALLADIRMGCLSSIQGDAKLEELSHTI